MKKTKNNNKKQVGFGILLVCVILIGATFGYIGMYKAGQTNIEFVDDILDEILPDDEYQMSWKVVHEIDLISLGAEAEPGENISGFTSVYFHPHQADIGGYMENSSSNLETNCTDANLGFANADDTEVDLVHSTAFDVVIRVKGNATNCKVGSVWYDTNLKVQWTCAGLSVGADTELTLDAGEAKTTANTSTDSCLFMNFFDTNSGAGFTISQDQTIEITSIKFLAYF